MSNDKYRDLFFDESDEYLDTLNDCLLTLEKKPDDKSVLDEIFRAAHTLKGMAATMGYNTMTELTHKMESIFELFRNGEVEVTSDIVSLIFKCLDKLSEIIEDLRLENYKDYDISALLDQLDQLESEDKDLQIKTSDSDLVVINNADIENIKLDEERSKEEIMKETKESNNNINQTIRVDLDKLDVFMNLVSELVIHRNRLESLSEDMKNTEIHKSLEQVGRITSELQDVVLNIRMQPVNVVFNRFPRMIRDLSQELGKEIDLVVEGEDTELDRTVVSEIGEPLVHLIRNAADHGIETVEERLTLGKAKKGTIKLAAYQEGNRVIIMVTDDGRGLDPQAISESAEGKGISTEGLGDRELINLIFNQGFSTVKNVTNVSGRGVGMDVVKQKISSLGGDINVVSEVNKGTSFIIKLPLTLSIIQALLIKVGGGSLCTAT